MFLNRKKSRGFTLIEMIVVIVLMGIIAGVVTPFILKAMQGYMASKARATLVSKGRLAMERLSREVRQAVPNSLTVLAGGTGIEFARARAGGRYVERFDNFGTQFTQIPLRFRKNANLTQLYTTFSTNANGTQLNFSANDTLVIANTSPAILQAGISSVPLTGITNTTLAVDGVATGQILVFGGQQFLVESPGRHFSIVDQTIEVGLVNGTELRWFTANGLPPASYDGAVDYSAADPVLVDGVTSLTFIFAPGTPQSSGVLRINLQLSDFSPVDVETINFYQEIHVRNTP